jgi:hypothetical protein
MKVSPACSDTAVASDQHIWVAKDFRGFLQELDAITTAYPDGRLVFRGHVDETWLIESTFVRNCKKAFLGLESHARPRASIRDSRRYLEAILAALLLKYDVVDRPSSELREREKLEGVDPLFELMKNHQQYPARDKFALKGTFFLDWTRDRDVALFFANCCVNDRSSARHETNGALFICDSRVTGKTMMRKGKKAIKVEEIISLVVEALGEGRAPGCPLLFHPQKQTLMKRAARQKAVYWAQMDLRYDLEYIWTLQEEQGAGEQIYLKLVLPHAARHEAAGYLLERGITQSYLFPD